MNEQCLKCGKCCTEVAIDGYGWVPIYFSDIRNWKKKGIFHKLLPYLHITSVLSETGYIIDFDENNEKCPFLINQRCMIQKKYGYNSKPVVCKKYFCFLQKEVK